jgi:hypothetical protein
LRISGAKNIVSLGVYMKNDFLLTINPLSEFAQGIGDLFFPPFGAIQVAKIVTKVCHSTEQSAQCVNNIRALNDKITYDKVLISPPL